MLKAIIPGIIIELLKYFFQKIVEAKKRLEAAQIPERIKNNAKQVMDRFSGKSDADIVRHAIDRGGEIRTSKDKGTTKSGESGENGEKGNEKGNEKGGQKGQEKP